MTGRAGQTRASAVVSTVVLAAVLVVVGLISRERFVRADLTERNQFTVSHSTREILSDLDDVVTVTVYASGDLPVHMEGLRTRIEDTLSEYRAYGGRQVTVRVVDPSTDAEVEERAESLGIYPVQLQAVERDRTEVVNTYMGLTVAYEDRMEVIPVLLTPERLEYELSSAILKLTADRLPVVGLLTGGDPGAAYAQAAATLEGSYEVRNVDPAEPGSLEGVDVLVAAGIDDVLDIELYRIDQFIMRGGRALFLLNAVVLPPDRLEASVATGNVYDFVSRYGARVQHELVADLTNESAAVRTDYMTMAVPYPFWPKAVSPNISTEHPVVSELSAIPFPWTSPIERFRGIPVSVTYESLATSSPRSWTVPPWAELDPQATIEPPPEEADNVRAGRAERRDLIVALTGRFDSAFLGKPVLISTEGGGARATSPEGRLDRSEPTQLIVIGNARMFSDRLFARAPTSSILLLNAVDWLAHGRRLIDVRSKAVADRPLRELSSGQRLVVRTVGTLAVPLVVIVLGLASSWSRRRRAGRPHR